MLLPYAYAPERNLLFRLLIKHLPPLSPKWRRFPPHITAKQLKEELPARTFQSFFKFAFVRNPWDWQVSLYHFMLQQPTHHQHELVANMSFDEYIEWRCQDDLHLQSEFILDDNGHLLVDFVGRFENLQDDFVYVCQRIGLPHLRLPHVNASHRRPDYRSYYNEYTKHLVEEYFRRDIELFGYSF